MDNKTLTWLHISDIHFGRGPASHRVDQEIICAGILKDAGEMVKRIGSLDLVLLTGDVAFKADPQEYKQAAEWLGKLLETIGIGKKQLYVVPGNHDVDRNSVSESKACQRFHEDLRKNPTDIDNFLSNDLDKEQVWRKFTAYAEFISSYESSRLSIKKPFWDYRYNDNPLGQPIVIVGLNTNLLSFDDGDANINLALGLTQLEQSINKQPDDALLLVLMHHPPIWLTDGSKLKGMLQNRPHILFYGHIHRQGGLLSRPISGDGSVELVAGAVHTDPNSPPEHAYTWGKLSPKGLDYYPCVWNETQYKFVADKNSFSGMNQNGSIIISRDMLPKLLGNWLPKLPPELTPAELTTVVDKGIRTLGKLMQSNEVKNATKIFINDFESAFKNINNVTYYKDLHEILHRLKPDCIDPINYEIKRFPENDVAVDIISYHERDLNDILDKIKVAVRKNSYSGSESLIQRLNNAQVALREAINELKKEKLIRVINLWC